MFYRISNYLFNLDEVINIHIDNDEHIVVDMKNNNRYIISETIDVNDLMDIIQKDLEVKGWFVY